MGIDQLSPMMGQQEFGARIVKDFGFFQLTETVTVMWFIMAMMLLFSILATRNMQKEPKGLQLVAEIIVKTIRNMTTQNMGQNNASWAPYIGGLLIFIALSNVIGLIGLRPPTADVNTTMTLAILTFILTQTAGMRSKGLKGYSKSFLEPMPFLLPLNIIGELSNPISLGFRLFGNIVAGVIIMSLLYGALGAATEAFLGLTIPILQVGLPAVFHMYFDIFAGLLQSFIFTMLTMVFISGAME